MQFILMLAEESLLIDIANKSLKQKDIALTYRLAMGSGERIDWGKVNRAIRERWSRSGLIRIKEMAHRGKF